MIHLSEYQIYDVLDLNVIEYNFIQELEIIKKLTEYGEVLEGYKVDYSDAINSCNSSQYNEQNYRIQHWFRNSLLISTISLFETTMNYLCNWLNIRSEVRFKSKKKENISEIKIIENYLNKILCSEQTLKDVFDPVVKYKLVRNVIVHNSGQLNIKMQKRIGKIEGLTLYERDGFLSIDSSIFLTQLYFQIEICLKTVFKLINSHFSKTQ